MGWFKNKKSRRSYTRLQFPPHQNQFSRAKIVILAINRFKLYSNPWPAWSYHISLHIYTFIFLKYSKLIAHCIVSIITVFKKENFKRWSFINGNPTISLTITSLHFVADDGVNIRIKSSSISRPYKLFATTLFCVKNSHCLSCQTVIFLCLRLY